jgi:uncharacterized membrane protein
MEETTTEAILPKKKPERIFELDFLRGVIVFGMLLLHFMIFSSHYIGMYLGNGTAITGFWRWCGQISNYIIDIYSKDDTTYYFTTVLFLMMGITATFSKSNVKNANSILIMYVMINGIGYLFEYWVFIGKYRDYIKFLHYSVLLAYALFLYTFSFIKKMRFNTQIWICGILGALSIMFIFQWESPNLNPLQFLNITLPADLQTTFSFPLFPHIFIFSLGTIIGQVYYSGRHSPFDFSYLKKSNICKVFIWLSLHSKLIFIIHTALYPFIFFLLTIIIL